MLSPATARASVPGSHVVREFDSGGISAVKIKSIATVILLGAWGATASAQASGKLLYSFMGSSDGDGQGPDSALVVDKLGNLYGTTELGGTSGQCGGPGCGTVFELSPDTAGGWNETVLYRFTDSSDGENPIGLVFDKSGNLYGTTYYGGTGDCRNSCGTVYELSPNGSGGWIHTVLYNFQYSSDADYPDSPMIFDKAGNLYGTAQVGGSAQQGAVFELSPNGNGAWNESVLYSFQGGNDGEWPYGLVFDDANNLYGVTSYGGDGDGCTYGCGTTYKLSPNGDDGWTESVIYRFCTQPGCTDGAQPFSTLGNL